MFYILIYFIDCLSTLYVVRPFRAATCAIRRTGARRERSTRRQRMKPARRIHTQSDWYMCFLQKKTWRFQYVISRYVKILLNLGYVFNLLVALISCGRNCFQKAHCLSLGPFPSSESLTPKVKNSLCSTVCLGQ